MARTLSLRSGEAAALAQAIALWAVDAVAYTFQEVRAYINVVGPCYRLWVILEMGGERVGDGS